MYTMEHETLPYIYKFQNHFNKSEGLQSHILLGNWEMGTIESYTI